MGRKYKPGDLPYISGSKNSHKAAKKMRPYSNTLRYRVWDYLRSYGPCTDEQIWEAMGFSNVNSTGPRRIELEQAGLVEACGTAITSKGRAATTYVVTGVPYPEKWTHTYRAQELPSERPFPKEFRIAEGQLREAARLMKANGTPFTKETKKVCRWLIKQGKIHVRLRG